MHLRREQSAHYAGVPALFADLMLLGDVSGSVSITKARKNNEELRVISRSPVNMSPWFDR